MECRRVIIRCLLEDLKGKKYNFPALLTQVMMLIHIDPVRNQVWMVSIPRDSWVSVPDIGGMHKIDQAFFLGATQNNSFDDGVGKPGFQSIGNPSPLFGNSTSTVAI